jgi:hypothetical protein
MLRALRSKAYLNSVSSGHVLDISFTISSSASERIGVIYQAVHGASNCCQAFVRVFRKAWDTLAMIHAIRSYKVIRLIVIYLKGRSLGRFHGEELPSSRFQQDSYPCGKRQRGTEIELP